ncbi:HK97 gp10 family phage protein [Janthinobacterium sp. SUN206]|uniref:HK97 gp10 family phage protein n=1 Tax=Janthinobacterium sp. SUN206 TaxID=3014787 RepID=UPI002712FB55|nr:HK97 gp10 family phage protein [Janthinobacterium sp. SUN206]MDO8065557.1 HK97 gp10 family phage protein [Janthinobacterium sp. SUN206]
MANMSFSMQIAEFIAKSKANQDLVVRAITMKVDNKLVQRSPVGDAKFWKHKPPPGYTGGRFRANWQLSIGSPAAGVRDLIDKDGSATLAAHGSTISAAKAGDVIYLVNNLPYAKRIEEGWSRQAPVGVVMLTVVEFRTIVDNAVNGVRDGTTANEFAQGYSTYKL